MMLSKLGIGRVYRRENRGHTNLLSALAKISLWMLLLGWVSWIVFHWLREAYATPAPIAPARARPVVDLDGAVALAAAAPIFGEAAPPEVVRNAGSELPNIKLKGVFASGAGPVAAIVNTGGEDEFVLLDRPLGPGVVLQGVYPSHIVISRNGAAERVELEALKSDASRSKSAARPVLKRPLHSQPALTSTPTLEEAPATPLPAAVDDAPPVAPEGQPAPPLAPPMQQSRATRGALPEAQAMGGSSYRDNPVLSRMPG